MQGKTWDFKVTPAGHLPGQVHRELDDLIRGMAGKRMTLKLAPYKKRRSLNQNAYYFGVVIPAITKMFREHGNNVDNDDCHEFLKLRVGKLAQVFVTPEGEVMKGLGSTAKLSTIEFEAYMTKCRAFAAEYGVIIKEPNEVDQPTEEDYHD